MVVVRAVVEGNLMLRILVFVVVDLGDLLVVQGGDDVTGCVLVKLGVIGLSRSLRGARVGLVVLFVVVVFELAEVETVEMVVEAGGGT